MRRTSSKNATGYLRRFIFPDTFPGFDGHFPGNPILPGVIQTILGELSTAEALCEEYPLENLTLHNITRCKFLRPVKPGEEVCLQFKLKTKGLQHISICTLTVEDEKTASFQLIFSTEIK